MRKLSWIIAGILCTTPATLMAAELGTAKLESHLTERLKVIIPISGLHGTPLDEVKVRLAPSNYYEQAGIPLDPLAGNIMFQIKSGAKGPYVLVRSKRSISDPILSMLLEVRTANGNFIKEYDLLLNPPVRGETKAAATHTIQTAQADSTPSVIQNHPATVSTPRPAPAITPAWHAIENVPDVKMDGEYKVKRGDTLYDIAKHSAPRANAAIRPLMQAIINANPQAFVDGNGNTLLAGAVLKVPTGASTAASAQGEQAQAGQTVAAASEAITADSTQPKLQLLSPDAASRKAEAAAASASKAPSSSGATGTASTADNENQKLPAIDTPSEEHAAATAQQNVEAIASIDAKSEAMSQQIEMLNKQLKQVQDQIVVRNQNIDLLQKKVHNSEDQTKTLKEQLEAQKNIFWIKWGPYLAGGVGLLIIALLLLLIRGRGRNDEYPALPVGETPAQPPITNETNKSLDPAEPQIATSQIAPAPLPTTGGALATAALGMASIPAFNAQTLIEESKLLASYNLHAQAAEMLQDAINDHPDEISLYQELARIYSETSDDTALSDVMGEIDQRFGAEQRPNLSDMHQSMQSAPIAIFDQKEDAASPDAKTDNLQNESAFESNDTLSIESESNFGVLDIGLTDKVPTPIQSDSTTDLEFSLEDLTPSPVPPSAPGKPEETNEPDDLSLDLSDPVPTMSMENDDAPAQERFEPEALQMPTPQEASQTAPGEDTAETEVQNDTRLGLVEAFLGVGDTESYKMIAEEIVGEGNPALVAALRKIEQAHGL